MLFDIINASLERIVIHKVGKKSELGDVDYSQSEIKFHEDDQIPNLLKQYFFDGFREPKLYHFVNDSAVSDENIVQKLCRGIFENPDTFYESSRLLAQALYESQTLPQIKSGELYCTLFHDTRIFETDCRCIGLFKSEHKDTFLKVYKGTSDYELKADEGIDIKKLDKGCLIFDIEAGNGYVCCLLDRTAGRSEASFWMNEFLGLEERHDANFDTREWMDLCKSFTSQVFAPTSENNIDRVDQADMLQRQIEYFKNQTVFDEDHFKQEVLANNEDICAAFDEHKAKYEETTGEEMKTSFAVSPAVVKKEASRFKSVIKLDKNFHIYIHGNRDLIERGFDQNTMLNYYKIYFDEEN